jgi:enamine deaminase RidA (YjgF/YER057c/UK114 family)
MKKERLNPNELASPRMYSHAVTAQGPGKLIYVSGQVSWDRDGKVVGKGDMRAQTKQVFENLTHALRAAGAGWKDVVKLNGYMVGMNAERVAAYREARGGYLDAVELPASTLVGVTALVDPDLLLEVEVVAVVAAV